MKECQPQLIILSSNFLLHPISSPRLLYPLRLCVYPLNPLASEGYLIAGG